MDLGRALDLGDSAVVSFVGAGGKKTAMSRLVAERGSRSVVYTTTTKMPPPSLPLVLIDPDEVETIARTRHVPIALGWHSIDAPERVPVKIRGFDPSVLDRLADRNLFDWILIKADGARGRELTAPAGHEPAIPARSTIVVVTCSVAAIGQAVGSQAIHRPEIVASLANVDLTDHVTPTVIARVVSDPKGGLRNIPEAARTVLLINKADTHDQRVLAEDIVTEVRSQTDRFDRALVTSFTTDRLSIM